MALAKLKNRIGIEEYIEGEELSDTRHEYIYGEVYAMAGTSDRHNRIAGNIFSRVDNHLGNARCEAFIESVKLKADAATFYYPDVMVACDETPESVYYREEPILLVEVLSHSTERTDRNEKLTVYKNIASLREYLIVWQDQIFIELHQRQADNSWLKFEYDETQTDEEIEFISIDMKMRVDEIYRRVRFENQ
jgi:Uma2 family endonuclease